jgi:hypothetical protein
MPRALRGSPPRADGTPEGVDLSQLIDFHRCRYRWHLRHRRRIERRKIAPAMDLGSAVHAGVAGALLFHAKNTSHSARVWNTGIQTQLAIGVHQWAKEWCEGRGELTDETKHLLSDTISQGIAIAERAITFMDLLRWRVIRLSKSPMIEQKIWWPIPGSEIQFYGTPDFVAEDLRDGGVWVHDWKVRERFVSSDDENFDVQLPTYQHGLLQQKPYIPTVGAIKWQFRSELPREPSVNKNGSMSRQQIISDWETYQAALIRNKLKPVDYEAEMRPKLDGVRFFQMDRLYRNDFQVQQTWNEIVLPMTRTYLAAKRFHRVMSTYTCRDCKVREICLAELVGEDIDFLLQTSFVDLNSPQALMQLKPEDFDFEEN